MFKSIIKSIISALNFGWFSKNLLYNFLNKVSKVDLGDFNRVSPLSSDFGYDRGGPIDRYFIANFLEQYASAVQGRVLEIGDNEYTILYGREKVTKSDIFHVNESNPKATLVGDLSNAPELADNSFDCIIMTQTLQMIYNFKDALLTCYRILKPGGTLLLTAPGITPIDHGEWKDIWYWAFTDTAMKKLFQETFPDSKLEIKAYGNVFTASAFLFGMGLPEISNDKLNYHDSHYQVIVTVSATKS